MNLEGAQATIRRDGRSKEEAGAPDGAHAALEHGAAGIGPEEDGVAGNRLPSTPRAAV